MRHRVAGLPTLTIITLLLGACVTTKEIVTPTRTGDRETPTRPPNRAGNANPTPEIVAYRAGESVNVHILAEVQPRGTIPYDNMTLPLVSPDGRYLATQTGVTPGWDAVLAHAAASVPYASRIEIYELAEGTNAPAVRTAFVSDPVVLGRSVDADGFLVEAPRADGSRWIGRASWTTGTVDWLVRDPEAISAFACLGPGNSLAWSSAPVAGGPFDLVVRIGGRVTGREWRLPGKDASWLMPTWACAATGDGTGHGLFVLVLRGDALDLMYMNAMDEEAMRRTVTRQPIAVRNATVDTAFQTLNAHVAMVSDDLPERDQLPFLHPTRLRSAVWTPPAPPVVLEAGSFAVAIDRDDEAFVLMSTMQDLVRRPLNDERIDAKLIAGPHVARRTASAKQPYILLLPDPDRGHVGVTVMRIHEAAGRAR